MSPDIQTLRASAVRAYDALRWDPCAIETDAHGIAEEIGRVGACKSDAHRGLLHALALLLAALTAPAMGGSAEDGTEACPTCRGNPAPGTQCETCARVGA